jgi:hypothetical protein
VDIINGKSYLWHKKETYRYTKIFGPFACRVCSKILGIGSAERSWGDVKTLKNNKRSHLSADRVKKQTTIFGASCIEQAKFQRQKDSADVSSSPLKFWRDDDFYNSGSETEEEAEKPKRVFKAYIEDWEEAAITKRDIVNHTRLLAKYGGLTWKDPDHGNMVLYSSKKVLKWTRVTKNGGGYCVMAHNPDYNEHDEDPENNTEPWCINEDLIECIEEYYTHNKHEGVLVISKNKKNDDENEIEANGDDKDDGSSTISTA